MDEVREFAVTQEFIGGPCDGEITSGVSVLPVEYAEQAAEILKVTQVRVCDVHSGKYVATQLTGSGIEWDPFVVELSWISGERQHVGE